ncbi:MAG: cell division protein ZapA [Bacillota bacterium]
MANEDKSNDNKHVVKILGEKLTVTGDISKQYVTELASYINKTGSEIMETYPHLPYRRLAGLTLVNIVHKYFEIQEKNNELYQDKNRLEKEKEKLRKENEELKDKIEELKSEYEELAVLLEEVDG